MRRLAKKLQQHCHFLNLLQDPQLVLELKDDKLLADFEQAANKLCEYILITVVQIALVHICLMLSNVYLRVKTTYYFVFTSITNNTNNFIS